MIIKKWSTANGGQWVEQYPKTIHTQIFSANDTGVKIFNDNGTLKNQYLPEAVFGGMTFVGSITVNSPSSPLELKALISGTMTAGYTTTNLDTFVSKVYPDGYDDIGGRYIGHYWVASTDFGIFDTNTNSEQADWSSAAFGDGIAPATAGGLFDNNVWVSAGDWVIITGWDNVNNTFIFNVVNNSYRDASTFAKGVVEFADAAEISTGTAANKVMSVASLVGKFAQLGHTHDEEDVELEVSYATLQTGIGDNLGNALSAIDSLLSSHATSITTNATDIDNLEARKEVFVSVSAPTANQANDIWFDI